METSEVLSEIKQIVEAEWAAAGRPVLLSRLPRSLEQSVGEGFKAVLAEKSLKGFLQEHASEAGVKLVQDPIHSARVGLIPAARQFVFPEPTGTTTAISAANARTFGLVLASMTAEEQRSTLLPASFVAKLLAAR